MKSTAADAQVIPFEEARRPEFSDDALALLFAERHAANLRYVAQWAKWLSWDGMRWGFDTTLHTFDRARHICRQMSRLADEERVRVASAKTIAAVERLARADRSLAATSEQWDADPWLLNTPGGLVDLRSGEQRTARPDDYCTKITAVAPGGECALWQSFLSRITGDDQSLVDFMQIILGYSLTGITREHALFFLYGTGGNGKSIFVNTAAGILADYQATAAMETFTASQSERHPTDLAGLRGARLVTVTETEEDRRWAESKIKLVTGGDKVAARYMRQDFFEFFPSFKLIISGNHMPGLRSIDEAMRRRFYLIPFSVTIPKEERDPDLLEKLKAEWPGILSWMVQGCLKWQRIGLQPPAAVKNATVSYLQSEDVIATWIEESCTLDPQAWASSTALFDSWSRWANKSGEPAGSKKNLAQKLEARGHRPHRTRTGRGFFGIKV